ncbi:hypothetical protein HD554DRAFT_2110190 [Boletus coccyginus]|nr:hypothetical protein HD554DRAFT_2110190 [Boletus coccyginus]
MCTSSSVPLVQSANWSLFVFSMDFAGLSVFREKIFMVLVTSTLYVAAAVDVLNAVVSTSLLFRKRIATGLSSEAHAFQRLAVFAVNTGIWTAAFALLAAILLHLSRFTFLSLVFGVPLCSVYCNTLLANLNVRAYIRDETHNNSGSWGYDSSKVDQQSMETKIRNTTGM